jgi:hypothetical protein
MIRSNSQVLSAFDETTNTRRIIFGRDVQNARIIFTDDIKKGIRADSSSLEYFRNWFSDSKVGVFHNGLHSHRID